VDEEEQGGMNPNPIAALPAIINQAEMEVRLIWQK
jgi:hypothetical protein